jgi:hypothetical protein
MTLLAHGRSLAALLVCLGAVGCDGPAPMADAGPDAGRVGFDAGPFDAGPPCATDEECDDGVTCTNDSCDMNTMLCRHAVDPASCDDEIFCNGVEQCDPERGCVPGPRQTCNDNDVCTIDRCDEEEKICRHFDRDLDQDGDADWFCSGGGDCDDTNPSVGSLVTEICGDFLDNDCDEEEDEADCVAPRHDTCDDPIDVSAGGTFRLTTSGATANYAMSCQSILTRDLVAVLTLEEERSVTIQAEYVGTFGYPALSLRTTCDDRATELACEDGAPAELRRRSLGPGTYFIVIGVPTTGMFDLRVELGEPVEPAANDTCASPIDVSAGGTFEGSFVEVADDLTTTCGFSGSPDLVYTFTTTEETNVRVTAQTMSGYQLAVSVRDDCADGSMQRRCAYGGPASTVAHQLPPGDYFIVVEGPTSPQVDFTLDVVFEPSSPPAAGDSCATAIPLTLGTSVTGNLLDKEDDLELTCGFRYRDAVYSFELTETSDVLIDYDAGTWANAAVRRTCADGAAVSQIRCSSGDPVSQRIRGLAAGVYFVIVEASRAGAYSLRVEATPPTPLVDVTGNDTCASAYVVPATGGDFRGDTTTLTPDLQTVMCGNTAASNDAAFRIDLTARRRVRLSTETSSFDTVLHVHRDMCRNRAELYCDDDSVGATSMLDLTLDAGTYYAIVDGWGTGSAGEYLLNVTITAP